MSVKTKGAIGVGIFIIGLVVVGLWRCTPAKAAEFDLRAGASFGPGGTGPVLGLQIYEPIGNAVDLFVGTDIWFQTPRMDTNWDWHLGFRGCRWSTCFSLGAGYLQRTDRIIGSHMDYNLGVSYRFSWWRLNSIDYIHFSDLGTTPVNKGLNAALISVRLQ